MVPTEAFLYGLEADEELTSWDLASPASSRTFSQFTNWSRKMLIEEHEAAF
jgi:hypothetical protein